MRRERAGAVEGGGRKVVVRLSEGMLRVWDYAMRPVLPEHSTVKYRLSDAEHLMSRD